jgi:putative membrane protein
MPSRLPSSTGSPAAGSGAGQAANRPSDVAQSPEGIADGTADMTAGQQRARGEPNPRVTLALERTFLAWIRTALALIAGGLAVSQLVRPSSRIITLVSSLALICFGALISLVGYRHWKRKETALRHDKPRTIRAPDFLAHGIGWFAVAAAILAVIRLTP